MSQSLNNYIIVKAPFDPNIVDETKIDLAPSPQFTAVVTVVST